MEKQQSLQDPIELLHEARRIVLERPFYFFAISLIPAFIHYSISVLTDGIIGVSLSLILTIVGAIVFLFAQIAIIKGVADKKLTDWKRAFTDPKDEVFPLLLVMFLVTLVVVIGYLFLILPGVYFSVIYVFSLFTHILEQKKGWKAAKASKELAQGYWLPIFGRMLLLVGVIIIYGYILSLLFTLLGGENRWVSSLGGLFLLTTSLPYSAAYQYLLYQKLREIKA